MLIPESPQWQALQWLVTADPLAPLQGERLVQRYALACLYFHWDGWLFSTAAAGWMDLVQQAAVSSDGMVTVVAPSEGEPVTTRSRVPLHECQWLGVTCNDQDQVVGLDFQSASFVLAGMIPTELGLLSHLTVLDCAGKSLVGTFSVALPQLQHLNLKGNRLNVFQETWGAWTNLETVNLAENRFEGTLPGSTLARWTKLRHFDIHTMPVAGNFWQDVVPHWPFIEYVDISLTELSGSIPEVTADGPLSRLKSLYASNTPLKGTLPASLTAATGLIALQLNDITGLTPSSLPSEIGKWTKLETWGLTSPTALMGSLPTEIGLMTSLRELNVYSNRGLNGTLPTELGHLKELQILKVCYTDLSGTVPDEIGTLKKLKDVQLHQTNLVGTVPLGLCSGSLNVLAADCATLSESIAPQMECPLGCCDCYA
jgi:Leucine-rich repeat (LRR) protein